MLGSEKEIRKEITSLNVVVLNKSYYFTSYGGKKVFHSPWFYVSYYCHQNLGTSCVTLRNINYH